MDFTIWVIVGDITGWIARLILHSDLQQGLPRNILVGIGGAALAGLVLCPFFGVSTFSQNNFSLSALLIALAGAILLLSLENSFCAAVCPSEEG